MNILLFTRAGAAEGFQEFFAKLPFEMEVYRNVVDLLERLRHPLDDPTIAVFVADSGECLEELLALRHLFRNLRVILVLPDRESGTISRGHDLQARFITYIDSDPAEAALVLSRMVAKAKERSPDGPN